ncbi:MAG: DivIVA domain-containing protein [Myxococcota bacterium]
MKLTPIDIQQHQFRGAFRGIDAGEVQDFLVLVAEQLGETTRENNELRTVVKRLERELGEHRDREETLKQAMVTAQRAIDEIREQATKEAQLVVTEAEMRAEKILHNANVRVTKLADEVGELKMQRARAVEELRGVLNTHQAMLETYDAEPSENVDGTVTILDRVRAPAPPTLESRSGVDAG